MLCCRRTQGQVTAGMVRRGPTRRVHRRAAHAGCLVRQGYARSNSRRLVFVVATASPPRRHRVATASAPTECSVKARCRQSVDLAALPAFGRPALRVRGPAVSEVRAGLLAPAHLVDHRIRGGFVVRRRPCGCPPGNGPVVGVRAGGLGSRNPCRSRLFRPTELVRGLYKWGAGDQRWLGPEGAPPC